MLHSSRSLQALSDFFSASPIISWDDSGSDQAWFCRWIADWHSLPMLDVLAASKFMHPLTANDMAPSTDAKERTLRMVFMLAPARSDSAAYLRLGACLSARPGNSQARKNPARPQQNTRDFQFTSYCLGNLGTIERVKANALFQDDLRPFASRVQ